MLTPNTTVTVEAAVERLIPAEPAWLGAAGSMASGSIASRSRWLTHTRTAREEAAMATRMQGVDVVLVGMGFTGTILAKELAEAGF